MIIDCPASIIRSRVFLFIHSWSTKQSTQVVSVYVVINVADHAPDFLIEMDAQLVQQFDHGHPELVVLPIS